MLNVTRVDSLDGLAAEALSWNRLIENSPQLLPTSSYAWISSYLEHRLTAGERWVCYFAFQKDELVGVLPLIDSPAGLRQLGRHVLRLPADLHTVSADLICVPEDRGEIVEALIQRAFADHPLASYLSFSRIPDRSSVVTWLRKGEGVPCHTLAWDGNGAYLMTHGSYDTFRAQLSSKLRQNQVYYRKQIAKLPGYKRQTMAGADATPEYLNRFMKVEAANWKGQAGTAMLNSASLRRFYATLVERLYACGWLRWEFIEVEGNPIAAVFAVHLGSRQIAWKIAYDTQYRRLSTGTILLDEVIREAFDDPQTDELDLLSDYPHWSKWRVNMRPYYNVCLYRADLLTWLFHYAPTRLRMELRRIPYVHTIWTYLKDQTRKLRV